MFPDREEPALAFGPVPSRRLGRSLGINNVPPKTCSYSCIYCQLGRTPRLETTRATFHDPDEIVRAVSDRVARGAEAIDALTFVPDGEPTLDLGLGEEISRLRTTGKRVAVISNASLLWRTDVRDDLIRADWVSVKVDAADAETWRRMNRPHRRLDFHTVLNGLVRFAEAYDGVLTTETMLVAGVNTHDEHLRKVAALLGRLNPEIAYVASPIRPPAESWVGIPEERKFVAAYTSIGAYVRQVEFLTGDEGEGFALSGGVERSLLDITAVHPMRAGAVEDLLSRGGESWSLIERLVSEGRLIELVHCGTTYYMRKIPGR